MSKTQKQTNEKANKVKAIAEEYEGWGDELSIQVEKYTPGKGWSERIDGVSVEEASAKAEAGWTVNFMADFGNGMKTCLRQVF